MEVDFQKIKYFFLVQLIKIVPASLLPFYWIALSRARKWLYGGETILRIEKEPISYDSTYTFSSYKIHLTDGVVYVPSLNRISRFLGGKNRAFQRIADIYIGEYQLELLFAESEIVFLDIGANIGEFSLGVVKRFPSAKVISIEPDPKAFACLGLNVVESNSEKSITTYKVALSDKKSTSDFFLSSEDADSSLVRPLAKSEIISLQTNTLDELLNDSLQTKRFVLKMDAEGFEPEVLQGAKKSLKRTDFLAIDVGQERLGLTTEAKVKSFLTALGFHTNTVIANGSRLILRAELKLHD